MIKTELRIGNLVYYNVIAATVTKIDEWIGVKFPDNNLGSIPSTSLEPIPLTPEILEKCGFEYNSTRQSYYLTLSKVHDFSIMFNEVDFYIVQFASAGIRPPVKYLHQLQNLFFCLCGEELEINL